MLAVFETNLRSNLDYFRMSKHFWRGNELDNKKQCVPDVPPTVVDLGIDLFLVTDNALDNVQSSPTAC